MRKYTLFILGAMLFGSCSLSKEVRSQRTMINGSWVLNNVAFANNTGNFKAVLFNDVEDICLEGSEWFFRNNNSTGSYTIAPSTLCAGGDRLIRWSVVEAGQNYDPQLQFKFIDEKNRDIAGGTGYRLRIDQLTERQMTLKSNVTVDGSPVTVIYEFQRK
ncbi:hypothetical protein [Maribacter sp. 2307ULW6-5]|uniref:hypothetical protein n=1 Tax=Maribacter sp. 2307ULW6-5 TaxID=3386275 RepID=UPI0039BCDFEB